MDTATKVLSTAHLKVVSKPPHADYAALSLLRSTPPPAPHTSIASPSARRKRTRRNRNGRLSWHSAVAIKPSGRHDGAACLELTPWRGHHCVAAALGGVMLTEGQSWPDEHASDRLGHSRHPRNRAHLWSPHHKASHAKRCRLPCHAHIPPCMRRVFVRRRLGLEPDPRWWHPFYLPFLNCERSTLK